MDEREEMREDMDTSKVVPLVAEDSPRREDVVGEAGNFIDDVMEGIHGEGIFRSMGISPDKTFLLSGVPGTGKTLSVRALNNEMNSHLINSLEERLDLNTNTSKIKALNSDEESTTSEEIPKISLDNYRLLTFEYDIGRYGTAYINMSSRNIQNFFDKAGILAKFGIPTMIVCDEADALLSKRGHGQKHSEDHKVIETLMKNIQRVHDTQNMYLALMTNIPEYMDKAVLRAGRIDKRYNFRLPRIEEREKAFKRAIEKANERAKYSVIRNYKTQNLAEMSDNFNYADIFQSVETALRDKAKETIESSSIKGGKIIPAGYITQKGLEKAVKEHKKEFRQDKYQIGFKT